ncbi:hypothetical protein LTR85_007030 [Meristemomyces frigidus]|nr:hypothetical protein LTR85_007030 [Meristemomyces frigidus]
MTPSAQAIVRGIATAIPILAIWLVIYCTFNATWCFWHRLLLRPDLAREPTEQRMQEAQIPAIDFVVCYEVLALCNFFLSGGYEGVQGVFDAHFAVAVAYLAVLMGMWVVCSIYSLWKWLRRSGEGVERGEKMD